MKFDEIVQKRYAVKGFDGRKIEEEKFGQLLEIIRLAPTSFNLQPWKIKVITDQALKEELQPHSWNQPQVSSSSHLIVFCADTNLEVLIDQLESGLIESGTPEEKAKAFTGAIRTFVKDFTEEKRLAWAQRQTYIALGNGMNGATALGFDACPMEGFDAQKFKEILKLPDHLVPTVLLPVGFANDSPRPKFRFAMKDFMID